MNIIRNHMGIFQALLSTIFFGFIPLFFIPLYQMGFTTESSVFFRFSFASLIMFIIVITQKRKLAVSYKSFFSILSVGLIYFIAALFLFSALTYTPSGIVTTLFFINPIFVMVLTILFFKEKLEPYKVFFSITTCAGVALLSGFFDNLAEVSMSGISLSLLSGIAYAFYIIGLYKLQVGNLSKEIISLYIFATCTFFAGTYAALTDTFMLPSSGFEWTLLFLSGFITVVLSNLLLMAAITKIGSVLTSILGATEPITAVIIGIIVFNEHINIYIITGIVIVITSVILITIMPMIRIKKQ